MNFKVLIERDEDGYYVATVPALPGCISQGRTEMEAKDYKIVITEEDWKSVYFKE